MEQIKFTDMIPTMVFFFGGFFMMGWMFGL
jgi:hypothetical protein